MTDPKQNNNDACRTVEVKYHTFLSLALDGNKWCVSRSRMTGNKMGQTILQEAQLFHVDRRTERYDEANSRFSKFCTRT
jgi:hypothetical protein